MSNSQRKWDNKIETLRKMSGSIEQKRKRAIHQMKMSGNQWVRAMAELDIKSQFAGKSNKSKKKKKK